MSAPSQINLSKLGIIAGGGDLPRQLVKRCDKKNIQYVTVGIKNHVESVTPDAVFRVGQAQKIINFFKASNVSDIVFIGSVSKPSFFTLWPDKLAFCFFAKAWWNRWGDDNLLRGARSILKDYDLNIHGIHQFLPELLMPQGVLGSITPQNIQHDIQTGFKAAKELGERDKGQAVIIKNGEVIAEEGRRGTSAMIKKYGQPGSILVKACKPQQDRDLDLPTLGPNTVALCSEKKMAGIVGEAGSTLLVDQKKMIHMADEVGLFIMGHLVDE